MQWNTVWSILGLGLLAVGTCQEETEDFDDWEQKQYKVSISGTRVELTCPLENDVIWEKNDKTLTEETEKQLVLEDFLEFEDSGYYVCYPKDTPKKNKYLYLKARVCENCVEVDLTALVIIILIDICITLGLLTVVYYWSKNRKAKAKPVTRGTGAGGRPRGQNKERPPPVPNPDYEPIRKGQRDLYSGLNQRAV